MAGTLAAVTSFLLASKIGIAGSVIGAAASYIVSAVATKIYQNILTASGEKLQSASSSGNDDDTTDNKSDKAAESESDTTMTGMVNTVSTARKPREVVSNRANGRTYSVNELRKARSHNSKRTAIIVTLVSGLLAVAVTAGIVMLVTQGRGTDHIITPSTTPTQTDTKTQTDTSNQNNGLPQPALPTVRMIPTPRTPHPARPTTAPIQARPAQPAPTPQPIPTPMDPPMVRPAPTPPLIRARLAVPPVPATVQPDRVQDQPMAPVPLPAPRADHPVQTPVIAVRAAPQPVAAAEPASNSLADNRRLDSSDGVNASQ